MSSQEGGAAESGLNAAAAAASTSRSAMNDGDVLAVTIGATVPTGFEHTAAEEAISRMGGLWKRLHTVWVNVGGLHAGVYLLKRTGGVFGQTPEDVYESRGTVKARGDENSDKELA